MRITVVRTLLALGFLVSVAFLLAAVRSDGEARSTGGAVGAQADSNAVVGDADCNGLVDELDAIAILQSSARVETSATCGDARADLNCNGLLDAKDALEDLLYVALGPQFVSAGCAEAGSPYRGGRLSSSFDLINAAVEAGDLSDEQGLEYQVFAMFGDSRLPPEYKGVDDEEEMPVTTVMFQLFSSFSGLSPQIQNALYPFMLPPLDPDSWYAPYRSAPAIQAEGSESICPKQDLPEPTPTPPPTPTPQPPGVPPEIKWIPNPAKDAGASSTSGKYKIWWPKERPDWEPRARKVLQYLDDGLDAAVTGALGRGPLDDSAFTYGDGPAIDIFYVEARVPILGLALPLGWADPSTIGTWNRTSPLRAHPLPSAVGYTGLAQGRGTVTRSSMPARSQCLQPLF